MRSISKEKKYMKKPGSRVGIISVLLFGLLIFALAYYFFNTLSNMFQPVNPASTGTTIPLTISQGETTAQIGDDLQHKGLIRNALAFRVWARIKGLDKQLQAGVYKKLSPSMTLTQIVDQLLNAQPDAIQVTVIEGWRIQQIANKLGEAGLAKFNKQDFLKYTENADQFPDTAKYPILKSVPPGHSMEGLLFPDTYDIPVNATAVDVIGQMLQATEDTISANHIDTLATQHQLTLYQAFILASLVQREIRFDTDAPGVASVYWNRIEQPNAETVSHLGYDPSVEYARDTDNPPRVYWTDLNDVGDNIDANSPWNTYTHAGWPPTPICSPGLASLLAAAAPPRTNNYFFLGKKDGHIVFEQNSTQFQADVQKYLNN
jgi:UPF0755 protein